MIEDTAPGARRPPPRPPRRRHRRRRLLLVLPDQEPRRLGRRRRDRHRRPGSSPSACGCCARTASSRATTTASSARPRASTRLQAALLRVKLRRLDERNADRRRLGAALRDGPRGHERRAPGARLRRRRPRLPPVHRALRSAATRCARTSSAHGVSTAVHYPFPIHLTEAYAPLGTSPAPPAGRAAGARRSARCRSSRRCRTRRSRASSPPSRLSSNPPATAGSRPRAADRPVRSAALLRCRRSDRHEAPLFAGS